VPTEIDVTGTSASDDEDSSSDDEAEEDEDDVREDEDKEDDEDEGVPHPVIKTSALKKMATLVNLKIFKLIIKNFLHS